MPIQVHRYPVNWPAVARAIKEIVGWECQECGRECRRPGDEYDATDRRGEFARTLTCAHVWPEDHAPDAPVVSVMVLCGPCHVRYDAPLTAAKRRQWPYRHNLRFHFPE